MARVDRFKDFTNKNRLNEDEQNVSRDPSMFDYKEKLYKGALSSVTALSKDEEQLSEFQVDLLKNIDDMAEQFYIIEEIADMAKGKGEILKDEMRKLPSQFFDEIDDLATKVLETKKFAITISKRNEPSERMDYKKGWEEITKYIKDNKEITDSILEEIKDKFTSIVAPRASTINVKPKLIEISDKISNYLEGVKDALERGELTSYKAKDIIAPTKSEDDENLWGDYIEQQRPSQVEDADWADFIRRNKLAESKFTEVIRRTWNNLLSWMGVKLNTMENNLEIIRGMVEQSNKYGRKNMEF